MVGPDPLNNNVDIHIRQLVSTSPRNQIHAGTRPAELQQGSTIRNTRCDPSRGVTARTCNQNIHRDQARGITTQTYTWNSCCGQIRRKTSWTYNRMHAGTRPAEQQRKYNQNTCWDQTRGTTRRKYNQNMCWDTRGTTTRKHNQNTRWDLTRRSATRTDTSERLDPQKQRRIADLCTCRS